MELELGLGLALPNHNPMMIQGVDLNRNNDGFKMENRIEYSQNHGVTTLSLLSWSQLEIDGGGARRPPKWRKPHAIEDDDECREIEGWQPTNPPPPSATERVMRKSMHVKVKMEGVAIGRKVDLRDFDSYHALTNTLIDMFAKYRKIERNREEYILLYLDKEGDWMLVGDVEWEEFVESVRRVEILKSDNKMGFRLLSAKT